MTKTEIIFILGLAIFVCLCWFYTHFLLQKEKDKNELLQMENSDLIDKNLKLQEEVRVVRKQHDSTIMQLAKKKELLTIQDRLLDENNIKH